MRQYLYPQSRTSVLLQVLPQSPVPSTSCTKSRTMQQFQLLVSLHLLRHCIDTALDACTGTCGPESTWHCIPPISEQALPMPQNCVASNIWDAKLLKCISEHRTLLGDHSVHITTHPELSTLLQPVASQPSPVTISGFLSPPISQWNFKLPEKLAIFWLNYIHLKVCSRMVLESQRNCSAC
jgi:hypothetical protein